MYSSNTLIFGKFCYCFDDDVIITNSLAAYFQKTFFLEKVYLAPIFCNIFILPMYLLLSKIFYCCVEDDKLTFNLVDKIEIE